MFTWNFQYVSRARLAETFNQLSLNSQRGDILIRIHTAIHSEEEAVELAAFIKEQVPGAHIFGTSTSAVIQEGKMIPSQCVISVTQMTRGSVYTAILPTFDDKKDEPLPIERLCMDVRENAAGENTKLMLTFLTRKYLDVYKFVDMCNDFLPGVRMIGGIADAPDISVGKIMEEGYVFDEKGWSSRSVIVAAISGEELDVFNYYATGVQSVGAEFEITKTDGVVIEEVDGIPASEKYRDSIGEAVRERPEIASLFPYVYSDTQDIPIILEYNDDKLCANHNVVEGKKIKRAFIYDKKIVADNRAMFRRIENFEKAETIFAYSCIKRSKLFKNSIKWELSAYENTNMCGCITEGEIVYANGKNTFANCSFVLSVMGEAPATQRFNSFVFKHTESLSADNNDILSYLMEVEAEIESEEESKVKVPKELADFIRDCELNLMYSESEDLPNEAALSMDMKVKGYDRICMIRVNETASMEAVFSEQVINMTYRNFIAKCASCAEKKNYHIYILDEWHIAIGAPSYTVKLSQFISDMEALQRDLFSNSADFIAIVPNFCIIDNCTIENLTDSYNTARMEMTQKNIQFLVYDGGANVVNVERIREKYHMVNVVNYAIAHDGVIPYYQGIHDNELGTIHHYESLMRIKDEDGKIYYPGEFLDVARSYGLLYDSISKIMIEKVFNQFRNYPQLSVSINLGLRDIKNDDVTEIIYDNLSSVNHPENFVFEILENEDVEAYEDLVSFVDKIHSLGGRISIDDFGSGYSNLQHIVSIKADFIKLDGSIIRNCHVDRESENLVALMGAWKDLASRKLSIVAEYVENKEIQKKLIMYGIDYSQGYLFSKPSPQIGEVK